MGLTPFAFYTAYIQHFTYWDRGPHACTHMHTPLDLYLGPQHLGHLELLTKFQPQRGATTCPWGPSTDYSFSDFCGQNHPKLCFEGQMCAWWFMLFIKSWRFSRHPLGVMLTMTYQIRMEGPSRDPAGMPTEARACPLCTKSGTESPQNISQVSHMA